MTMIPTIKEIESTIKTTIDNKSFNKWVSFSYQLNENNFLEIYSARNIVGHYQFDIYLNDDIHHTCWEPIGEFLDSLEPMHSDQIPIHLLAPIIHQFHRLINLSAFL